jgi:hypothetical protein
MSIDYNANTTTEILEKYLFEVMRESKLDAKYVAYNLEFTFGDKIHKDIYGFINFMESENENPEEIVIALVHDITGAMTHDTLMIPRVSEYGKHA